MKKSLLILAALLFMGVYAVFAQGRSVSGTVVDSKGEGIFGATVTVQGGSGATQTQEDGSFEINVPDGFTKLLIEYMGLGNQVVNVSDDLSRIVMTEEIKSTGEAAVISLPYGRTMPKSSFSGSGERITSEQIRRQPITNATSALAGRAAGVVLAGGNNPGGQSSIRIRGLGSFNGNAEPLIVVDGNPFPGQLSAINSNDIESMDVLKDATATSLYGSRGANGVILITTKSGKGATRTSLNVDARMGTVTRSIPNYDILTDPKDYYEFAWDAYRNNFINANGLDRNNEDEMLFARQAAASDLLTMLGNYNSYRLPNGENLLTDDGKLNPNAELWYQDSWDKELLRVGFRQEYNVSAAGGNSGSDYYLSLGYTKEKGYLKYTEYDRFTGRTNVNAKVSDWAKVGLSVLGSIENQDRPTSTGSSPGYNPFMVSRTFAPIYPVYYYDSTGNKVIDPITGENKYDWGSENIHPNSSMGTRQSPNANVLGALHMDDNSRNIYSLGASPNFEAKFLKDFTFRTNMTANFRTYTDVGYNNKYYGQFSEQGGRASRTVQTQFSYSWNQILSWAKRLESGHNFDAFVGHENYDNKYTYLYASRLGLSIPGNTELSIAANPESSYSYSNLQRIESYFGNVSYNYKGKYFLTANLRRDGISHFHPNTRWGNFWSVGGSWMVDREKFIEDVSWIDMLKVKLSYGTQGEPGVNWYAYQSLFGITFNDGEAALQHLQLPNVNSTWEKQAMTNFGIDFEIFKRVRGELAIYRRIGSDMLMNRPYPPSTGYNERLENILSLRTNGIELRLDVDIVKQKDFLWNLDLNFSHFAEKIISLRGGDNDSLLRGNFLIKNGYDRYQYYLAKSVGVDSNGRELYSYYDTLSNSYRDTTEYTHAIANGGREMVGSGIPWLQGGFTNTFTYKNFDLSFLFTFGLGGLYYDDIYQTLMGSGLAFGQNVHKDWLTDRWTIENPNGKLPAAEVSNTNLASNSDRFLISRTYLSMRNINLGYTFKNEKLADLGLQSLRLYVMCDNVFLMTKRKGMDPQGSFSGQVGYMYNPNRIFMVGLNVGL